VIRPLLVVCLALLIAVGRPVGMGGYAMPAAVAAEIAPQEDTVPAGDGTSAEPALPLFAYYYQWFDPTSWNRAKNDYPQAGRYSSDDSAVMRQQIRQAKSVGITGFIVSWKDTPTNTRRLRALVGIAAQERFSLAMIYQGLDFNRQPLPAERVRADLIMFRDEFAENPVFYRVGGKVLTIWSGTWSFSHAKVASVTSVVRSSMLVLSTEKSVAGFRRLADVTDGDAYYWSSVNPVSYPSYGAKLQDMAAAIHAVGKYWIAPFAPGFDARAVGGGRVVPRNAGATLRLEYSNAVKSSPDALGLISWNEFSENSYIEPSLLYGQQYLDVLRDLTQVSAPPSALAADSSGSEAGDAGSHRGNLLLLGGFPLGLILVVGFLDHRRRRSYRRTVSAPAVATRADPPTDPEAGSISQVGLRRADSAVGQVDAPMAHAPPVGARLGRTDSPEVLDQD
jgi:hypothetical protein